MRLCGLICHSCVCVCVRVLCHRVRVYVVVVVVQCVCAHVLALCCGSLGLHAAVRTYLPPARACDVPPRVCVCVCACACVCLWWWWWWWCSVCVCTRWPFAVAVWDCMRLCGLICHPLVRVMCHHVCVCVCACVCVCVPALCSGSWLLHAAVRTYLSPACVCDVRPLLWQSGAVCGCADLLFGPSLWQSGAGCACADLCVGPLLCQSGVACGCADLLSTFLRV